MRITPVYFLLSAFLLDCATLTPIEANTCGNGVVDANEDCDSSDGCGKRSDGVQACRLVCDRKKPGSCPVGWGCSVDSFCRQATGTFSSAISTGAAGVDQVLAGDFDGDGRADVYGGGPRGGSSKPRVYFFGSDGTVVAPVTLPVPMSAPLVKDFDGDGLDDLGYVANNGVLLSAELGGVGVLSGTTDRAFRAVPFPTVVREATDMRYVMLPSDPDLDTVAPFGVPAAITLQRDAAGTFLRSISGANITGLEEFQKAVPIGPEQVAGRMVRGRLFTPSAFTPLSICGDLVIPYNVGDVGHLSVVTPCALIKTPAGGDNIVWATNRPLKDVVLPARITGRTLISNLADRSPAIYVQTSLGTFAATTDGFTIGDFARVANEQEMPLAIADLSGHKSRDFVGPTGISLERRSVVDGGAGGDASPIVAIRPPAGRWLDAQLAYINDDTRVDVVAISPEGLEVEVYGNAGATYEGADAVLFTRYSVSSPKPVRAITVGDYDGDRIQDVAFLASTLPLGEEGGDGVDVLIAHGKSSGAPEPARLAARFARAIAIDTIHASDKATDDIIVIEQTPAANALPTTTITVLISSGDRHSIAPLIFSDSAAKKAAPPNRFRSWRPMALVSGTFFTPDRRDMLSIATGITFNLDAKTDQEFLDLPFPTGMWLASGDPSRTGQLRSFEEKVRFEVGTINALNDRRVLSEGVVESLLISASADIDNPPNGVTEVVSLARTGIGTQMLIVRGADIESGTAPKQIPLADIGVSGDDEIHLFDVDADDLPDAVVLTRGRTREKLRVYLNDRSGGFQPTPIDFDVTPKEPNVPADGPLSVARIVTGVVDGKPRVELAVVTKGRLLLGSVAKDKSKIEVRDLTSVLGTALTEGLTSIAAGDFDGDGVEDLALADSGSIRIVRQQPRLP